MSFRSSAVCTAAATKTDEVNRAKARYFIFIAGFTGFLAADTKDCICFNPTLAMHEAVAAIDPALVK